MPEDFEEYWKVIHPRKHRVIEERNPSTPTSTPLQFNQPLVEALGTIQRYAQRLEDGGWTVTMTDPVVSEASAMRDAYNQHREQGLIPPDTTPYDEINRQAQETANEMIRRGIHLEPGFADRMRADLGIEVDPATQSEPQRTTYAELEVQFQACLESTRDQGIPIDSDLSELRSIFLEGFYDSTRSEPVGDPGLFGLPTAGVQLHRDNPNPQSSQETGGLVPGQFSAQLGFNNYGVDAITRANQQNSPLDAQLPMHNGRVSDDLLREFTLIGQDNARLVSGTQEDSEDINLRDVVNYERLRRRQNEILLNIVNLFDDLGVSCSVLNHRNSNIELQFSLLRGSSECPASIESWVTSDGVVHLELTSPAGNPT